MISTGQQPEASMRYLHTMIRAADLDGTLDFYYLKPQNRAARLAQEPWISMLNSTSW